MRGDIIEIFPASSNDNCVRVEMFGDTVEAIYEVDPLRGQKLRRLPKIAVYPNSHYVTPRHRLEIAMEGIKRELADRIKYFEDRNMLIEAQRIDQRTSFDLEMIKEIGYCHGIENYSRHLSGRKEGEPPPTLIDYLPKDSLIIIDESHVTIPQITGMWAGDKSRKKSLVEYGFRLPSAYDNRPLTFVEFEKAVNQVVYVSATPGPYELKQSEEKVVEQVIRPTGLMDPKIIIKPAATQVDDLLTEIKKRVEKKERVLVTTLTKRMAEDLTEYYHDIGIRVQYLHSEIETLERVEIIRNLRAGEFDVLIGINLLREGLDLPEVSLVAILDADKEGFLRSFRSLIQTAGRAARHVSGEVIMYADVITNSIKQAIDETERRRKIQMEYNKANNITPEGIKKGIYDVLSDIAERDYYTVPLVKEGEAEYIPDSELPAIIKSLEKEMRDSAKNMEFEKAAKLRDRIKALKERGIEVGVKA